MTRLSWKRCTPLLSMLDTMASKRKSWTYMR
jgi:hypothetical protein